MIEQLFRVPFFVVALVLLKYTRALVTMTVVLAIAAYFGFTHPSGNSAGEEVVVFIVTWAAALVCAGVISLFERGGLENLCSFELSWWTVFSRGIDVKRGAMFFVALVVAFLAYLATEILGYEKGTFAQVQSMMWLIVLMLVVSVYDELSGEAGYHLLPPTQQWQHRVVLALFVIAVQVDILVNDSAFWKYLVPADGAWLLLQLAKWLLYHASTPSTLATDRSKQE